MYAIFPSCPMCVDDASTKLKAIHHGALAEIAGAEPRLILLSQYDEL